MNITKNLFILLPIFAIGCEQVDSVDVRTDGIYADIKVEAIGDGHTDLSATLLVGGAGSTIYLDLVEGDELTAFAGNDVKTLLRHQDPFGQINYKDRFNTDSENTRFRIAFTRVGHDATETMARGGDALNSIVTLPALFAIQTPAMNARFSAANDDVEVSWSNSGKNDEMKYWVSGPCIKNFRGEILNDNGRFTITHDQFLPKSNQSVFNCDVEIRITRSRAGTLDSAYGEGGIVKAHQIRTVEIELRP